MFESLEERLAKEKETIRIQEELPLFDRRTDVSADARYIVKNLWIIVGIGLYFVLAGYFSR